MIRTYEELRLTGHSATIVTKVIDQYERAGSENVTNENKAGRTYNGDMSPNTVRRVGKMLDSWLTAVEVERIKSGHGKWYRNQQVTFVTLTLPAEQVHSDNEIKRNCLNQFIQWLKRKQGVKTYFWRAEPQSRGAIHFHLLIDRAIHWRRVRQAWNSCVETLGYLSAFEAKHGHRNPNSTDIHGLEKVRNTKAYVTTYVTKNEGKRPLQGRVWGCSDNLRDIQPYAEGLTADSHEAFENLQSCKGAWELEGDFYLYLKVNVLKYLKSCGRALYRRFEAYYYEVLKRLQRSSKQLQELSRSIARTAENCNGARLHPLSSSDRRENTGIQLKIEAFFSYLNPV